MSVWLKKIQFWRQPKPVKPLFERISQVTEGDFNGPVTRLYDVSPKLFQELVPEASGFSAAEIRQRYRYLGLEMSLLPLKAQMLRKKAREWRDRNYPLCRQCGR